MTQYECLVCKGSGQVPNPDFEQCANLNDEVQARCNPSCSYYSDCSRGETIFCDNCNGNGSMTINPEKWQLMATE